ncbi:hypothetical protein [Hymenobacter lucidus]|uniref:GIY-YIG domain-containing protein n=1 Tax=Hymenobacter lucidus TaxID=2880930 RepID=A0ABS8AWJ6_9BACT|nr:hypothetical protein [Hymenobacter lucidus]MCB2410175.1 hypothetical protein [Hymenobacter lucidus]
MILHPSAPRATVYTTLGHTLRVPLRPGSSPERQLIGWLQRQMAANPGFSVRVKSVLLVLQRPPCAACGAALRQFLRRWNLTGKLRLLTPRAPGGGCGCAAGGGPDARPTTFGYDDSEPDDELAATLFEALPGLSQENGVAGATKTFSLQEASQKLRAPGWKRGLYVIHRQGTPIYVGKASDLPVRVQQHALCLSHLLVPLAPYTVQIHHYPAANEATLLARERELMQALRNRKIRLGNSRNTELELSGEYEAGSELNELVLEYEGLFEKFRRLFGQNPVKAAVFKGMLDAANPAPARDAALADQTQAVVEQQGLVGQQQMASLTQAANRPAAGASPPPRPGRLAQPATNWTNPATILRQRVPPVRLQTKRL